MSPKSRLSLSALAAAAALYASAAPAGLVTADYTWSGAKGWRAAGTIRYDDVLALVTAAGPLGAATTGIEYLDLTIFDAAGLLKGSWVEVANSATTYNTIKFSLDTATDALAATSKLEIGNTAVRSAYFGGTLGKSLVIAWNYSIVDTGPASLAFTVRPAPDPEPVPAPGTSGLLLLGLVAGAGVRRARRSC